MTLYMDTAGAGIDAVLNDLYVISGRDGQLGWEPIADPTVMAVTYTETQPGLYATRDRLNALVNTDLLFPIVCTALNGGIDPYKGEDVTGKGFTYLDMNTAVIRCVYDVSLCNGAGIWGISDQNDAHHIAFTTSVMLYHELSHAYHDGTGAMFLSDVAEEVATVRDENALRSELLMCQRSLTNDSGGCGTGDMCLGDANPTGCFIVSASSGSPDSEEVIRLKDVRDRFVRATSLGRQLMDAIYRDYYRFSPRMAADLRGDERLREEILKFVVRPLIAWYSLAEIVSLTPWDVGASKRSCAEARHACLLGCDATVVAEAMVSIKNGAALPADAPPALAYLARHARVVSCLTFASWAILAPLTRIWASAAAESDLREQVFSWLATAPLEMLSPPAPGVLDAELAILAWGPLSRSTERHEVGRRLAIAWPQTRNSLARHDFVDTRDSNANW